MSAQADKKRISLVRRKARQPRGGLESPLISLRDAAALLCCPESTLRQGQGGFNFTFIRRGEGKRRRIFLIREEVEEHLRREIEEARRLSELPMTLVYGT